MANVESSSTEPTQLEIVKPIVKTQDAITDLRSFEELKSKLLSVKDYQVISGKNFIKKSGWRKLALVFNISDQIIGNSKETREDGSFIWTFKVRASAPNGRFTEAVAACDSRERRFAHPEHDVFGTAHTRAKSRAISDLIGAGEISAEEMDYDAESPSLDEDPTEEEKERVKTLFQSANQMYKSTASPKVEHLSTSENSRRFDLTLEGRPFPVMENEPPFSRFFLEKICKSITKSNPGVRYELERDGQGKISAIVWYGLPGDQQKEVESTLAWSLKKVAEKRRQA